MINTQIALQLAAARQHELESLAARRRLAHQLAPTSRHIPRADTVLPALRRIAASFPRHHLPSAAPSAAGRVRCCAA